jgi:hypothetical protein
VGFLLVIFDDLDYHQSECENYVTTKAVIPRIFTTFLSAPLQDKLQVPNSWRITPQSMVLTPAPES